MPRALIGVLLIAGMVGFCRALFRVPLRYDIVERSVTNGKQKRNFGIGNGLPNLRDQYPLHEYVDAEKKLAIQPLKVAASTFPNSNARG